MADNNFGFELRADDQASAVLQQINDQVKVLQPELAKAREGLALGGQGTEEGLSAFNTQFQNMSRLAKDNVQLFGDMVPPLKNVTSLAGDFAGKAMKFGAVGALAYGAVKGISAVGSMMSAAADDAYSLDMAAKNAGMSVRDMSRYSGAMQLLGTDNKSAQASVESWYKTFNEALQGRNSQTMSILKQNGVDIVKSADGKTADAIKTFENLARIFPTLSPQNQKTVADTLGIDANTLQLLREGVRLKELLAKSDKFGLTVDPETNTQLVQLNRQLNEFSGRVDGLIKSGKIKMAQYLLSPKEENKDMVSSLADAKKYDGKQFWHGDREKDIRWRALRDDEFKSSLSASERLKFTLNMPDPEIEKKLNARYGAEWSAAQLQHDLLAVNPAPPVLSVADGRPPSSSVNPRARSVRNNNPWNLRYAGQRGATRAGDNFAAFSTPEEGLLAADRQLKLYASGKSRAAKGKPLTTLRNIISVASPKSENDTTQMIRDASRELQTSPDSQLNLADPGERSRVLHALFEREGNNPWSTAQIQQLITNTGAQPESQAANQTAPQPLSGNGPGPSPVTPLITPPQPASPVQTQELTETLATALKDNGIKVELTLINDKTGDRKTFAGSGGKIATAMTFP